MKTAQDSRRIIALAQSVALTVAGVFVIQACANGPCRQLRSPQRAATQAEAQAASPNGPAGNSTAPAAAATPPTLRTSPTGASSGGPVVATTQETGNVFVFKADGSQQCGMGKAISVQDMEKELKGIRVFSREKKPDGLMHIQVCGSPTGIINVYEISVNDLSKAVELGFKKLERP